MVKNPRIELDVGNITIASEATIVEDSNQAEKVVGELRAKYSSMWSNFTTQNETSAWKSPCGAGPQRPVQFESDKYELTIRPIET